MKPNKRFRLVLTGLLCAILLFSIVPRAKTIYELSVRKNALLQEKEELTRINEERLQALAEIDSPAGIERIAREQLGMVKKGERTIIRVIPSE
ncbi:MAG: septum formation initiator family protein [Syntrophomonas sp.]|jgi:cell division protein FtsB|nr:septum formation initiator family protein [Syntrophomonas sp.]